MFELHQKWRLFYSCGSEKKTSFLLQLKLIFGPTYKYFDRSLENLENYYKEKQRQRPILEGNE